MGTGRVLLASSSENAAAWVIIFFLCPSFMLLIYLWRHTVSCAWCKKSVFRRKAVPPSSEEAVWEEVPGRAGTLKKKEVLFCGPACRDAYEASRPVRCAWDRTHVVPRKEVQWGHYAINHVKGDVPISEESVPFCSLRCRNSYEASRGIKEERKRLIGGE